MYFFVHGRVNRFNFADFLLFLHVNGKNPFHIALNQRHPIVFFNSAVENKMPEDGGWRTTDNSGLDREEKDDGKVFHFNVIMDQTGHRAELVPSPGLLVVEDEPPGKRSNRE
jgi:hypothetical protein